MNNIIKRLEAQINRRVTGGEVEQAAIDEIENLRGLLAEARDEIELKQACISGMSKNTERLGNALNNCRLLAAQNRSEEWAKHVLRFCEDAGVGGSPLRVNE